MTEPRAQRTLVKSPPELWAEISDVAALASHLGEFGEIRIVRLEPETTVAWEGDTARGTVELEASGWGTKVTLTAELVEPAEPTNVRPTGTIGGERHVRPVEPEPAEPEPVAAESAPQPIAAEPEPEPEPEQVAPEPEPVAAEPAPQPPAKKAGFFARLFGGRAEEPPRTEPPTPAAPKPTPVALKAEPVRVAEPPRPAKPQPVAEPQPLAVEEPKPVAEPRPVAQPVAEPRPVAQPVAVAEPPRPAKPEPVAAPQPAPQPQPVAVAQPDPDELRTGEPVADRPLDHDHAVAVLTAVLDDLGSARHRPFSR